MNTSASSNGTVPLTAGTVETFSIGRDSQGGQHLFLNGAPWNIAGGSASISFMDPSGNVTSFAATITNGGLAAQYSWSVPAINGQWARSWTITDAVGNGPEVTQSIQFNVVVPPTWG